MRAICADTVASPEEHLLLREFSHRVHNEFAAAMAVLSLTAAQSRNDEVKAALKAARERLYHYAQVHRALEIPAHDAAADAASHLQLLCDAISRSKLEHRGITITLRAQPILLRAEQCWRLGMIVAELITNAMRHAFDGGPGAIRVELSCTGSIVECCVVDNGSSSSPAKPGRGLGIIKALTESLNGRIEQQFGPRGSVSVVTFPAFTPEMDAFVESFASADARLV